MKNRREDGDVDGRFYLLARSEDNDEKLAQKHEMYAIDDEKCESEMISPVSGMGHYIRRGTKEMICVVGGSKICVVGGLNCHPHHVPFVSHASTSDDDCDLPTWLAKDFWYLDLDQEDDDNRRSWIQGPSMRWGRVEGFVVAHAGKIYVFGGDRTGSGSLNEVFDTSTQEWSPFLEDFSSKNFIYAAVQVDLVVDETTGRKDPFFLFYVINPGFLYQYNIATQESRVFDYDFGRKFWDNHFVLTSNQNVLATVHHDNRVWGYRLDTKEWSIVHGLDGKWVLPDIAQLPDSHKVFKAQVYLFPFGNNGKLCLIWGFTYSNLIISNYHFHYTKFTIEIGVDGALYAHVDPLRSFQIDGIAEFNYCFTHDSHQKSAKKMKV